MTVVAARYAVIPGQPGAWKYLAFTLGICTIVLLRGRSFVDRWQSVTLAVASTAAVAVVIGRYAAASTPPSVTVTLICAAATLALVVIGLTGALVIATAKISAPVRKAVEVSEWVLLIFVLPWAVCQGAHAAVLDRTALEESPLADLHEIASELSIDGYRRLRRAELIGAILDKQGGPEESHRESEDAPTGAVQDRDDGRAASTDDREHPSSAEDEVPAESTAGRRAMARRRRPLAIRKTIASRPRPRTARSVTVRRPRPQTPTRTRSLRPGVAAGVEAAVVAPARARKRLGTGPGRARAGRDAGARRRD